VIAPDSTTTRLALSDFTIENKATWKSPHTGATYPARWHVTVPSQDIVLDIEPLVADQELNVSLTYWEGAVRITGTQNNKPISGYGYVELTGYSTPVAGQF
jgi:predicted secreted hydrolase